MAQVPRLSYAYKICETIGFHDIFAAAIVSLARRGQPAERRAYVLRN
jgi:hypothetical protein